MEPASAPGSGHTEPAPEEENQAVEELLVAGSEIVGGAVGVALAFLLGGGAEGAYSGAAAAPLVKAAFRRLAWEVKHRLLAQREEVRVGTALGVAGAQVAENVARGMRVRQDDFFEPHGGGRSPAEEVTEGVLLAAQQEYEERKVPFQGRLLTNLLFHAEIDRADANHLIRLSRSLSYRQLCLLQLFVDKPSYPLRNTDWRTTGVSGYPLISLLQEILDLQARGMLQLPGDAILGLTDIAPARMQVAGTGAELHDLMELWRIDKADIDAVARLLSEENPYG